MGPLRVLPILGLATGLLAAAPASSSAQAYTCGSTLDTFDRPALTNLGPNWLERKEDWRITSGTATQDAEATGVMTFVPGNSRSATVCVDVDNQGAATYRAAGIMLAYANLNESAHIRVDSFGSSKFSALKIIYGMDGEGGTHNLDTPRRRR